MTDIKHLSPFYNYSLAFFTQIFQSMVDRIPPALFAPDSHHQIPLFLMREFYKIIGGGMFQKDRLIFGILLIARFSLERDIFRDPLWSFLLTDIKALKLEKSPEKRPLYVSQEKWNLLHLLGKINPAFTVHKAQLVNVKFLQALNTSPSPFALERPDMQPLMFVAFMKIFRPEHLSQGFEYLIDHYFSAVAFEDALKKTMSMTDEFRSLLVVIQSGYDVSPKIDDFEEQSSGQSIHRILVD